MKRSMDDKNRSASTPLFQRDIKLLDEYPHVLQMYEVPPVKAISIEELKSMAYGRMNVLFMYDKVKSEQWGKSFSERKNIFISELKKNKIRWFTQLMEDSGVEGPMLNLQSRRIDHISHFVAQVAYSLDADTRRWFLNIETELFAMRYLSLRDEGLRSFLDLYKIRFETVSEAEKHRLGDVLCTTDIKELETKEFLKVPFREVKALVARNLVYVEAGIAYVPSTHSAEIVTHRFNKQLGDLLIRASVVWQQLAADPRMGDIMKDMVHHLSQRSYNPDNMRTTRDQLDELSRTSYPPCMQRMHMGLRHNHHLKNSARLQYLLFLKGIGLPPNEAMEFWREEFTKNMMPAQFEKEYAYHVRHSYGQEGRRAHYQPFDCTKLISVLGSDGCSGCPLQKNNLELLEKQLKGRISLAGLSEVSSLVAQGRTPAACTRYFEELHHLESGSEEVIIHPNQFYKRSCDLRQKSDPK